MFVVDAKKRAIKITDKTKKKTEIKEGEKLDRKFLEGTQDKYECVLKLVEVDVVDPKTQEKTGKKELKAFAQKIDDPNWLLEFIEEEYSIA